jgi:predicted nucleic-acid-binding Zn-ribbon protein
MKNGQCLKCGSREVFSNTNRKFPALNTMTIGSGNFGNRYAYLDTYVCVHCGYVENYVAKQADLNYIKEEWTAVREESEPASNSSGEQRDGSSSDRRF